MHLQKLAENTVIGSILNCFSSDEEAKKSTLVQKSGVPIVHYTKDAAGEFIVSITLDNQERHFQCLKNYKEANEPVTLPSGEPMQDTGFKAMAWLEIDAAGGKLVDARTGKYNVITTFPGWIPRDPLKPDDPDDPNFVSRIAVRDKGNINPQVVRAPDFVAKTIAALNERGIEQNAAVINMGAHSNGVASALFANYLFHQQGFDSQAVLIDGYGSSLGARELVGIIQQNNLGSDAEKIATDLAHNVVSVDSYPRSEVARRKAGVNDTGENNRQVGDGYVVNMLPHEMLIYPGDNADVTHRLYNIANSLVNHPENFHRLADMDRASAIVAEMQARTALIPLR